MARSPKNNSATVIVEDAPSIGSNSAPVTMFDLAKNDATNQVSIVALLKAYPTREAPALTLLRDEFYDGFVAAYLNVTKKEAREIIGKKGFSALPTMKMTDDNRTQAQERAYGSARTRWTRLLDITFPKVKAKPEPRTKDETVKPKVETVKALVVERAASPADSEAAIKSIVMHLRQWRQLNADKLVGERGALIRAWIAEAPDFNS